MQGKNQLGGIKKASHELAGRLQYLIEKSQSISV
jgi:hypothetical protein